MFSESIVAISAIITILASAANAAEINGTVISAETNEPLAGAVIKLKSSELSVLTDGSGRYSLAQIPAGDVTLMASVIGYHVSYRTILLADVGTVDFALTPQVLKGQDVVVTATRAKDGETPATFANYPKEDIEKDYWMQDTPMLLANLPNIFAYSDAGNGIGYSYLKLRGFNQNRVAVTINGIPLNGAESHEVYWVDLPDFASSLQDIQVQRGVGSSLYGQSALGGSINMVTSDFSVSPWLKAESGAGSHNTRKLTISGNSGLINDSYVFYSRFSKMQTDGYREQSWVDMYSYYFGAARYDENMTWKFNTYGGPEELHLAYKGITAEQLTANRKYNEFEYADEIDHFNQPHYEFFHDWKLNENFDLSNTLYYFRGDGYYNQYREDQDLAEHNLGTFYDFDSWNMYAYSDSSFPSDYYANFDSNGVPMADTGGQYAGYYQLAATTTDLIRKPVVGEYDWGWIPNVSITHENGELILGGEMRLHQSHHYGEILWAEAYPRGYAPNLRYHDYRGYSRTYTAYARETYRLRNNLRIMAGLQYQRHNYKLSDDLRYDVSFDRSYDFISPRLGILYKPGKTTDLYISASMSSRQPTFQDIYDPQDYWSNPIFRRVNFEYADGAYSYIGKELKPEKLFDLELGGNILRKISAVDLRADFSFYRMEIRDELIPYAGQIDDMNLPVAGNAEKTLHQGAELSISADYNRQVTIKTNICANNDHFVSYSEFGWDGQPVDLSGNRIGGFPDILANYQLVVRPRGIELGLRGVYFGRQYIDNTQQNEIDSYNLFNFDISYDFGKLLEANSLKASVRIQNLFDKKYVQAGYSDWNDGLPRYMVGAERNVFISLSTEL